MFRKIFKKNAMTFIELLIVASLLSILSIALYNALSNGLKVWSRSNRSMLEDDVVIFLDKINSDLKNSFYYSKISFSGSTNKFSFPTMVRVEADPRGPEKKGEYIKQIGKVEYYFDPYNGGLYRRFANYGKAENNEFFKPRLLVSSIDSLRFKYFYARELSELESDKTLETFPSAVEVTVEFSDQSGIRSINKFINIAIGS